jgi:hypothetical protein
MFGFGGATIDGHAAPSTALQASKLGTGRRPTLSYLPLEHADANRFFQLINRRYPRPTNSTTNPAAYGANGPRTRPAEYPSTTSCSPLTNHGEQAPPTRCDHADLDRRDHPNLREISDQGRHDRKVGITVARPTSAWLPPIAHRRAARVPRAQSDPAPTTELALGTATRSAFARLKAHSRHQPTNARGAHAACRYTRTMTLSDTITIAIPALALHTSHREPRPLGRPWPGTNPSVRRSQSRSATSS